MLFLLDYTEFVLEVNSRVHITELDEGNGVFVSNHTLHSQENNIEDAEITLYALQIQVAHTILLTHKSLVILIDLGGTHNFIDTSLLSQLHILVDTSQISEVKVTNGDVIRTQGLCKEIRIFLQGHQLLVQLHVLPMGGCDLVLRTHWLSTLGIIQWDFKLLIMCSSYEQKLCCYKV